MKLYTALKIILITALALAATACSHRLAVDSESPRAQLNDSPRHQEWVAIEHDGRTLHAYLVYPEKSEKAHAVLVIHENKGLTDWVCNVADQLAAKGYIAIAPDLLSGAAPGGGKTSDFPDDSAAREAIYNLLPDQVTADLDAAFDYVAALPAADGTVSVAGFCWGGAQSFRYATHQPRLTMACVFYGTPPRDADAIAAIACPVYGFYGGNDARVSATIPDAEAAMKAAGKTYEPVVYEGAGHGFMRAGEAPGASDANIAARATAWDRWERLLKNR